MGVTRFDETIRLPQPYLGGFVAFAVLASVGLTVLWAVASLTVVQRVVLGVVILGFVAYLFLGPVYFVAMHVVVDQEALTRRVGHRRRRILLSQVTGTRIEGSGAQHGVQSLVLTLRDGSEYPIATRRAMELAEIIKP